MKIKQFIVVVSIIDENGKEYTETFENMSDAGKFAENVTKGIYGI